MRAAAASGAWIVLGVALACSSVDRAWALDEPASPQSLPAACQLEGAQEAGDLPPANSASISYYRDITGWYRLDHGTGTVQPAKPSIGYSSRCDGAWQLLEISGGRGSKSLVLRPPYPVALDRPRDDLLVGAGARWSCSTVAQSKRRLRCTADDGFELGAGQIHRMQVRGDRLRGPDGAALPDFEFDLHTIKPTLRIEPNPVRYAGHELLALAPMALRESTLREALTATIDERPVPLELEASSPAPPFDRTWAYQHPWPAQQVERELRWEASAVAAWRLRLERTPQAGQRVQIWLRGSLRSLDGGHAGPSIRADFASLLYQEMVPEELTITLAPQVWPTAALPALLFSRPPAPDTLRRLVDALPEPLHSYPELLEPVVNRGPRSTDPRGRPHEQGWRLPLLGRPTESTTMLRWRQGRGVLGERLPAGELDLSLLGTWYEGPEEESTRRAAVAEPRFALHAIKLPEQWVVVASEARAGRPLAGVQLSDAEGEELDRAPTNADGLLTLPRDLAGRNAIRGSLGDATVDLMLTSASRLSASYLGEAEPMYWWVDAPAHGAGTPFRFVVLSRQGLAGLADEANPVSARLVSGSELHEEIALQSDHFGRLRGELQLPPGPPGSLGRGSNRTGVRIGEGFRDVVELGLEPQQIADQPEVTLETGSADWIAGRWREVSVFARYADGSPAVGHRLSVSAAATPAYADPLALRYPGFRFRDPASHQQNWRHCRSALAGSQAHSDAQGRAELSVQAPPGCEVSRLWLTVHSGEPTNGETRLPAGWSFAHGRQLGLAGWRSHLPTGEASFRVLAVDLTADGKIRPSKVRLQALRVDGGGVERHSCRLRGDGVDVCRIRFRSEGLYRLILEAPGYPTRQLRQAVGAVHALPAGPAPLPVVRVRDHHLPHGQPIEWSLIHEYSQVRVLALLSDGRLRAAQWLEVPDDPAETMHWLPPADVSGCLSLGLLVLPVVAADEPPRQARLIDQPVCVAPPRPELLSWSIDASSGAGGSLRVRLVSHSQRELALALRAVDGRLQDWYDSDGSLQAWLDRGSASVAPPSLASSVDDRVDPLALPACGLEFEICRPLEISSSYWPEAVSPFRVPAALNAEAAAAPVQTLAWLPNITLAPGESRTLETPLPSHAASWRVEVLALDGAGGFQEMQQVVPVPRR